MASIAGQYNVIYAYNGCDSVAPWKKYDPAAPFPFLNDLTRLSVGQGVWLRTTSATLLPVTGRNLANSAMAQLQPGQGYWVRVMQPTTLVVP